MDGHQGRRHGKGRYPQQEDSSFRPQVAPPPSGRAGQASPTVSERALAEGDHGAPYAYAVEWWMDAHDGIPARWMTGLSCLHFEREAAERFAANIPERTRIVALFAPGEARPEPDAWLSIWPDGRTSVAFSPLINPDPAWGMTFVPLYRAPSQQDGWRPIEQDAPPNTEHLVFRPRRGRSVFMARKYAGRWFGGNGDLLNPQPTHWMPLPAAPREQSEQGGDE